MPTNKERPEVRNPFSDLSNRKRRITEVSKVIKIILNPKNKFSEDIKHKILYHLIWFVTEADGKYTTRFRSSKAISSKVYKIQHEHIFPVRHIKEAIFRTPSRCGSILSNRAWACVVAEEEHRNMNKRVKTENGLERYKKVKIKITDMKGKKPRILRYNTIAKIMES